MSHKNVLAENAQLTKNFNLDEFKCNEPIPKKVPEYFLLNTFYLAVQLQKIRDFLQLPQLRLNCAYRTKLWNAHVGGQTNSYHLFSMAADIVQDKYKNADFYDKLKKMASAGLIPDGEILKYETFVHYAPTFEINHYPIKANNLYPEINKELFTYDKNINHEKFNLLQEIR